MTNLRGNVNSLQNTDLDTTNTLTQVREKSQQLERDLNNLKQTAEQLEETVREIQEKAPGNVGTVPTTNAQLVTSSRLVENVTVMAARLEQLRTDVISLRAQSIAQAQDLVQIQQDLREITTNTHPGIPRPNLVQLSNDTLRQLQASAQEGRTLNITVLTLLFTSVQQLQWDSAFLYQNMSGLQRQMSGVRSDFAELLAEVSHFQSDLDELQWNNAQLYYDMEDVKRVKDTMRGNLATLQESVRRINQHLGLFR